MHGAATLAFLERLRADWAVLGASGLLPDGPADASMEAGEVYAAMVRRAARRIVVADASKVGRAFPVLLGVLGRDRLPRDRRAAAARPRRGAARQRGRVHVAGRAG
jgi:DeoR/GlpR family transcriptional regulator of sugar metabolism